MRCNDSRHGPQIPKLVCLPPRCSILPLLTPECSFKLDSKNSAFICSTGSTSGAETALPAGADTLSMAYRRRQLKRLLAPIYFRTSRQLESKLRSDGPRSS